MGSHLGNVFNSFHHITSTITADMLLFMVFFCSFSCAPHPADRPNLAPIMFVIQNIVDHFQLMTFRF